MATETQRERLRADLQINVEDLGDPAIDNLYIWAADDGVTIGVEPYVRILAILQLMAGATRDVDVRINEFEVKNSQRYPQLERLYKIYSARYTQAVSDNAGVPFGNGLARKPRFDREWPIP